MADYIVIYDSAKEIAAIVNADDRIAFGPAMIGPDAEDALTRFLGSVEYDVTGVDSAVLRDWFEEWAGGHFRPSETPAVSPAGSAVEPSGGPGMADAARAEAEASAAGGGPPGAAPADPDMEADAGPADALNAGGHGMPGGHPGNGGDPPPYTGPCFACGGAGTIALVDGEPPVVCSACRGTGRLPAPATS